MSLLVNEFDVRSVLHGQVSLAAVNQFYVIHEVMNGCKKSKDTLKACFENVNIRECLHFDCTALMKPINKLNMA